MKYEQAQLAPIVDAVNRTEDNVVNVTFSVYDGNASIRTKVLSVSDTTFLKLSALIIEEAPREDA